MNHPVTSMDGNRSGWLLNRRSLYRLDNIGLNKPLRPHSPTWTATSFGCRTIIASVVARVGHGRTCCFLCVGGPRATLLSGSLQKGEWSRRIAMCLFLTSRNYPTAGAHPEGQPGSYAFDSQDPSLPSSHLLRGTPKMAAKSRSGFLSGY